MNATRPLTFSRTQVLFKMDGDGNGKEILLSDLGQNTPLRFNNFTQDMFRQMCILSGCDYLPSITGLGVKKAHGLLSKYRTMDRVFRFLRNDRNFVVPPEYEEAFERAERTFLHQSVYDHINQRVGFALFVSFLPHQFSHSSSSSSWRR
jgi:exonuclease-1